MYQYFYLTMLVSVLVLCITNLARGAISKRYIKIWGYITNGFAVISIVSLIGFAVALI